MHQVQQSADKRISGSTLRGRSLGRLAKVVSLSLPLLVIQVGCGGDDETDALQSGGSQANSAKTGGASSATKGGATSVGSGGNIAQGGKSGTSSGGIIATGSGGYVSQTGGGPEGANGGAVQGSGGAKSSGGATSAGGAKSSGGEKTSGGATSAGGAKSSGGAIGMGGEKSSSGSSGSSGDNSIPMTIPTPSGTEIRNEPTVLAKGEYDLKNLRVGVKSDKGCDGEGQPAVFELEDGVTLKNVIITGGVNGGNGILCRGNCTLDHVYWEEVCEDAATNLKDGSTMRINQCIAKNATDKIFQHNSKGGSKTIITNSYFSGFGKVWRSCGDCTANGGPRHVEINNVRVEGGTSNVVGVNENFGDTATIKNLYVKGGYNASTDKPKICQVFTGVVKGNGSSTKMYEGASQWNSKSCIISVSDVKSW